MLSIGVDFSLPWNRSKKNKLKAYAGIMAYFRQMFPQDSSILKLMVNKVIYPMVISTSLEVV